MSARATRALNGRQFGASGGPDQALEAGSSGIAELSLVCALSIAARLGCIEPDKAKRLTSHPHGVAIDHIARRDSTAAAL
jgi:hypothetical protein